MYTINLSMGKVVAVSKALPNVTDTGEGWTFKDITPSPLPLPM